MTIELTFENLVSQTASILAQQAELGPVIEDERLRERSVGEWSGLTYEEVRVRIYLLSKCVCLSLTDSRRKYTAK